MKEVPVFLGGGRGGGRGRGIHQGGLELTPWGFFWGALQAFVDILASDETFGAPMDDTYRLLGLDAAQTTTLEAYLGEYFSSILKKLKEVGATSRQTDFYV